MTIKRMLTAPCRSLLILLVPVAIMGCAQGRSIPAGEEVQAESRGIAGGSQERDKRAQVMRLFMDATRARLKGEQHKAVLLYESCIKADPQNSAAMFELSKLYHMGGDPVRALDLARRAVATDKENIWYRFLLADLYQQSDRPEDAVSVYQGILQRWPERIEVYFDLANTLAMTGRSSEAVKVFRDLEKQFGTSPEFAMQEFGMLANSGRMEEAEGVLQRAIKAYPGNLEFLGMLAELHDQQGRHKEAADLYRRLLELEPDNSLVRVALAEHHYAAGEMEEAFEQLGLAFSDPDLDVDAKMQVLLGFFELTGPREGTEGRDEAMLKRAYGLIDVLLRTHPESGKPHAIHGDFLLRDKRNAEARDAFRSALQHEKDRYPIWQQLLQLDLQLGDHEALHADAEEALVLFPTAPVLHLFNGIALSELGRHDDAEEALVMGREMVVDDVDLVAQFWSSMGDAYHRAGHHDRSDEAFAEALRLRPRDPNILNNHAYYLSLRGDKLELAEEMSRRSNEIAPGQPSYQDTYAWVLHRMGRHEEARRWIEKALASGGSNEGVIVEHHGDILFALGDTENAKARWREAQAMGGASDDIDRKVELGRPVE